MKGLALLVFLQHQHLQLPTPEALLLHDLPVPPAQLNRFFPKWWPNPCPFPALLVLRTSPPGLLLRERSVLTSRPRRVLSLMFATLPSSPWGERRETQPARGWWPSTQRVLSLGPWGRPRRRESVTGLLPGFLNIPNIFQNLFHGPGKCDYSLGGSLRSRLSPHGCRRQVAGSRP